MDLEFDSDLQLLRQELDRIITEFCEPSDAEPAAFLRNDRLEHLLEENGFYDIAATELGMLGAVLLIDAVGRTPFSVETVGSALIAPLFGLRGLSRPVAIIDSARSGPVRFLTSGCAALVDAGDHVRIIKHARVEPVHSFLASPFGSLIGDPFVASTRLDDVPIDRFRQYRRLGVSAEIVAAMFRALEMTVDYTRQRVQFGKPIATFQAVAHRLAECAAIVDAARWLVLRAASTQEPVHASVAIAYAQDACERLIWETNQLHGAVGLTLEYPLHYWNYRLRVLQGEAGGPKATLPQIVASRKAAEPTASPTPCLLAATLP